MIVVLGMITSSMLEEVYLELRLSKFQREDFEALALARAGLAKAVADLRNDLLMDRGGRDEMMDALGDVWARGDEGKLGRDGKGIELGRGTYRVWVEDETAKFDLNTIALNRVLLKALLNRLGLEDKEAAEVANAIIDWRDMDDVPQPPGTGKEDEYYSTLADKKAGKDRSDDAPLSYHCKNDRFSSVEELLSVAGVTPKLFYGVDPEKETPPGPIERLTARAEQARERHVRDRHVGLRDVLTVHSNGAININTADEFVLSVVFRTVISDAKVGETVAKNLIQLRKPDAHGNFSNDKAFRNIGELNNVAGMPPNAVVRLMPIVPLTVRSDVFCIYALGEVGRSQHLIGAHVTRSFEACQPDYLATMFDQGVIHSRLIDAFRRRHGSERKPIEAATVRVVQWQEL